MSGVWDAANYKPDARPLSKSGVRRGGSSAIVAPGLLQASLRAVAVACPHTQNVPGIS